MKLRCSCGSSITIALDQSIAERDRCAMHFYEAHSDCREATLAQSRALQDIAATLHDIFLMIEQYNK